MVIGRGLNVNRESSVLRPTCRLTLILKAPGSIILGKFRQKPRSCGYFWGSKGVFLQGRGTVYESVGEGVRDLCQWRKFMSFAGGGKLPT